MFKKISSSEYYAFKFCFIVTMFFSIVYVVNNIITVDTIISNNTWLENIIFSFSFLLFFIVCYSYNLFRMWTNLKSNKSNIAKFFLGPWMFIPQTILGTITILFLYPRPMETGIFDRFLFFQGSIDMGGELSFVATIALYVLFGFTASWYVVLKLEELDSKTSFFKMFLYLLWVLKFHIVMFMFVGLDFTYDSWIIPNDFRNMFILVSLLYFLTIVLIIIMRKLNIARSIKLVFAPIFIVFWLYIGSDGNTARANQIPIWEDNPHYVVTSKKHAVMIAWHNLCDDFFGDPKPHYTHQYKP